VLEAEPLSCRVNVPVSALTSATTHLCRNLAVSAAITVRRDGDEFVVAATAVCNRLPDGPLAFELAALISAGPPVHAVSPGRHLGRAAGSPFSRVASWPDLLSCRCLRSWGVLCLRVV